MSTEDEAMAAPVSVKVKGVYIAESEGSAPVPVVLLEDEMARIVPIFVGLSEAVSIHHALSGELSPRPMTHDLFISVHGDEEVMGHGPGRKLSRKGMMN